MSSASWSWDKDPPDGVACLVSTRRVLDAYGYCCDYDRCGAYLIGTGGAVIDRCILPAHVHPLHHGEQCRHWSREALVDWAAGRAPR